MNPLKRVRATRLALAALGAVGVLAIFVGVAAADTSVTGTATLTPGTLAIANPSTLSFSGALNVSATYFSDTADTVQVANPGGATGWNVTAYYDGFTCQSSTGSTGCTASTDTLGDTLSMNGTGSSGPADTGHGPTSGCYVTGCTPATPTVTYPIASVSTSSGSPTKIYNASAGTGVGGVDSQDVWWLTAPANAKPGTYTSTITLAINAVP